MARSSAATQELPARDRAHQSSPEHDTGRRLAAFAAGGVLVVGAVAALHHLYRSGDGAADLISWAGLLLLGMTALGGGIKLAMWGARPIIAALFDGAKERLAEPVLAVVASGAVIVGALGMWWTFRGGYASWWRDLTGESQWSLSLGIGQMLVAVLTGAALFTGGQYLTGLVKEALTDSGLLVERDRAAGKRGAQDGLWHPGLVAALVGGGLGLVLLTAGITPRLYVWITGAEVLPAVAAIAAVLAWAIGSNLGWWKGLAGLWKWATDASHKAAATTGVVALLMFSAGGLGLGWFTPATVPQAHAQCPPDCGGGSNGSNSYGPDASQFQPPQMPNQMPDYQGGNYGSNQAPLDQNSGISIYNTQAPSVSNNGVQGSSGQQGPQQGWDQPAHGTQIPDYQNATPYTQGPGKPNPDFNGGQANPGSQGGQPNQGGQQPAQQPPQQQPPQQDAGQEPNQQPQQSDQQKIDDLMRQLQEKQQQSGQDQQRIDDLTKQLQQNKQNQKQQQSTKFPSKDKKKDDKDEQGDRDDQSQNTDLASLLLGAASTRRRKQDEQEQGPDTQALGKDASQAVQGLPGDVQTYVQSGQQIGESSGQAAQGFGSAAQAGASLASSAQSGAVNPQDAITVVQGVSQGIQGTADAVNAGSQIVKTAQGEADQVAQAVGDANPQLKPQTEQFTQLNDTVSKGTEGVGQVASGVSQVSGAVNSVSGMGSGGVPTEAAGEAPAEMVGWEVATSGPADIGGDPGGQGVTPRFIDPNALLAKAPAPPEPALITPEQLHEIYPTLPMEDVNRKVGPLNDAMRSAGMTSKESRSAFLGTFAVESGEFKFDYELRGMQSATEMYGPEYAGVTFGPNAAHDPNTPDGYTNSSATLGNTQPGDGYRFRGRGPIQLTGRGNYQAAGQALGLDLTGDPDLAASPEHEFAVATWFWNNHAPVGANGLILQNPDGTNMTLNQAAEAGDFASVTRAINGGLTGFAERQQYFDTAMATLQ
ncbi:hypothetical protein EJ571_06400 [Mycobacteroides franklinii]|uniref:Glycoside hydrolase family 19 catalytic domain-containing protein n=1 Tax=Mycobacteroides franklinii TaxID=948102 RepID=A0A4R5PFT0_9MYCO|nr:hypothetical protein EJ571_06400 [Mycobacteroides franklinii]